MRDHMARAMVDTLENNRVQIGEQLEALSGRHAEVLSTVTGVARDEGATRALLDGRYCVTGDAVLKARVSCVGEKLRFATA